MPLRRVAFISDLHGNLVALDAVLEDIDARGADQTICLGDIVDLGPRPLAVIERLRQRGVQCIRGNHDTLDEHPDHPALAQIEAWTRDQLGPVEQRALTALPTECTVELEGGSRILCVHGSPRDVNDQLLDVTPQAEVESWIAGRPFDVLVAGHTHVQLLRRFDTRLIVNVGSVGMPFVRAYVGGAPPQILPWCEYALVSADERGLSVELRRVPLDFDAFADSVRSSGFPSADSWLASWTA